MPASQITIYAWRKPWVDSKDALTIDGGTNFSIELPLALAKAMAGRWPLRSHRRKRQCPVGLPLHAEERQHS